MKKLVAGLLLACVTLMATAQSVVNYASRPASATGTGYFVAGDKVFDPTGKEFRIRGFNINHYDINHVGMDLFRPNVVRTALYLTRTGDFNWTTIQNDIVARGAVPMVESQNTTCKGDFATLDTTINTWLSQASTWQKLNTTGFFNPANEWGPTTSQGTGFFDGWAVEIPKIRTAGITAPIVIDAGNCGQDASTIVTYGKRLLELDPEHNLLFSVHVYGTFHFPATASWQQDYTKAFASLKATGLPIIVGEFGPGRNIGPSPTMVPPEKVVADAEANGWGWLPWSWDNNNLLNCGANDNGFSFLTNVCKPYTGLDDATQLTLYGKSVKALLAQYQPVASLQPVLNVVNGAVGFKLPSQNPATYKMTYTTTDGVNSTTVPVTVTVGP